MSEWLLQNSGTEYQTFFVLERQICSNRSIHIKQQRGNWRNPNIATIPIMMMITFAPASTRITAVDTCWREHVRNNAVFPCWHAQQFVNNNVNKNQRTQQQQCRTESLASMLPPTEINSCRMSFFPVSAAIIRGVSSHCNYDNAQQQWEWLPHNQNKRKRLAYPPTHI